MVVEAHSAPTAATWPSWPDGTNVQHPSAVSADPDGLVGLYAQRALDRGADPRSLVAEHRATRYGLLDRLAPRSAQHAGSAPVRAVGRGTDGHREAMQRSQGRPEWRPARVRRVALPSPAGLADLVLGPRPAHPLRSPRRLVTAGLAALLVVSIGAVTALAQERPPPQRYVVQPGDPLDGLTARFGTKGAKGVPHRLGGEGGENVSLSGAENRGRG